MPLTTAKGTLWFAKAPGLRSPESTGNLPESRRPFPEATQKPKVPSGERCSCSWLVPSGNTSTTRPTVRARLGALTSSTLSACRGGALANLQGDGERDGVRAKRRHGAPAPWCTDGVKRTGASPRHHRRLGLQLRSSPGLSLACSHSHRKLLRACC